MPLLVVLFPGVDSYGLVPIVAALLGAGEVAQRVENGKTRAALHETLPHEEATALQDALLWEELIQWFKATHMITGRRATVGGRWNESTGQADTFTTRS
ncbi:hypothetical protein ACFXPY_39310 [Streptomyces sp. NPDC059153]|uniref:hypothetical protein n=1 Tax=Streptomyces sp. NPDC059153 TaxID=3346743 RepID=UPI00368E7CA0